jgi:hypothetical protein
MALLSTEHRTAHPFTLYIPPPQHLDQVALVAAATAPVLLVLWWAPLSLVLPLLSIVSFVVAGIAALFAHYSEADHRAKRITPWSVAAVFTLIWIVAGAISDPRHVVQLFDRLATAP